MDKLAIATVIVCAVLGGVAGWGVAPRINWVLAQAVVILAAIAAGAGAGWQWAVPLTDIPDRLMPNPAYAPGPLEWADGSWRPTAASDQWQLAALCFTALAAEPRAPPLN